MEKITNITKNFTNFRLYQKYLVKIFLFRAKSRHPKCNKLISYGVIAQIIQSIVLIPQKIPTHSFRKKKSTGSRM